MSSIPIPGTFSHDGMSSSGAIPVVSEVDPEKVSGTVLMTLAASVETGPGTVSGPANKPVV